MRRLRVGHQGRSPTRRVTVLDMYDMSMPIFMSMCGCGLLCWAWGALCCGRVICGWFFLVVFVGHGDIVICG